MTADDLVDYFEDFLGFIGFGNIVKGPGLNRNGRFPGMVGRGHHDHFDGLTVFLDLFQDLKATHLRHVNIKKYHIEMLFPDACQGTHPVTHRLDFIELFQNNLQ